MMMETLAGRLTWEPDGQGIRVKSPRAKVQP